MASVNKPLLINWDSLNQGLLAFVLRDEREHSVLPLIHGLYSGKIQQRTHWSQWSLVSCHVIKVLLSRNIGLYNR